MKFNINRRAFSFYIKHISSYVWHTGADVFVSIDAKKRGSDNYNCGYVVIHIGDVNDNSFYTVKIFCIVEEEGMTCLNVLDLTEYLSRLKGNRLYVELSDVKDPDVEFLSFVELKCDNITVEMLECNSHFVEHRMSIDQELLGTVCFSAKCLCDAIKYTLFSADCHIRDNMEGLNVSNDGNNTLCFRSANGYHGSEFKAEIIDSEVKYTLMEMCCRRIFESKCHYSPSIPGHDELKDRLRTIDFDVNFNLHEDDAKFLNEILTDINGVVLIKIYEKVCVFSFGDFEFAVELNTDDFFDVESFLKERETNASYFDLIVDRSKLENVLQLLKRIPSKDGRFKMSILKNKIVFDVFNIDRIKCELEYHTKENFYEALCPLVIDFNVDFFIKVLRNFEKCKFVTLNCVDHSSACIVSSDEIKNYKTFLMPMR